MALKKNNLKASRTKVAISWTLDQHSIRGDKIEMLETLKTKLRDYVGDVETYIDPNSDLFVSDKTVVVVACSKFDADNIEKHSDDSTLILVKANPLCEMVINSIN